MNSKILTVVVVVILAVAGIAVYFTYGGDKEVEASNTSRLNICGNADMNDYLDSKDIEYTRGIISGERERTPLSDANNDGVVDEKDIDQINKIINKTANRINYLDINNKYAFVSLPIKSVAVQYWPVMYGLVAVGAEDIVDYVDSSILKAIGAGQYGTKLKNAGIETFGSGFHDSYDFEKMISIGVDTIVCGSADIYFLKIEDRFNENTRLNVIRLPFWEADSVESAYLTLAYLLNDQKYIDKAYAYVDYVDGIKETINAGLNKVSKKADILVTYVGVKDTSLDVEIECRGSGSYECSVIAGMNNLASYLNSSGILSSDSMYFHTDQEYLISKNPDYIMILSGSGLFKTTADQKVAYDKSTTYLTTTSAYKDGNIILSSSGLTSGMFQSPISLMLACTVYQDAFKDVDSNAYLQELVDRFTLLNEGLTSADAGYFDVTKDGAYLWLP